MRFVLARGGQTIKREVDRNAPPQCQPETLEQFLASVEKDGKWIQPDQVRKEGDRWVKLDDGSAVTAGPPPAGAGSEEVTVNEKVVVPLLPSFAETSLMLSAGLSSFRIVPTPSASATR